MPGASTEKSGSLPYDIFPLSFLPYYNKNSPYCVATYANRSFAICKSPCKYHCQVCSDTIKGNIVAVCGLKSKNGSACITRHIMNASQQCNCPLQFISKVYSSNLYFFFFNLCKQSATLLGSVDIEGLNVILRHNSSQFLVNLWLTCW